MAHHHPPPVIGILSPAPPSQASLIPGNATAAAPAPDLEQWTPTSRKKKSASSRSSLTPAASARSALHHSTCMRQNEQLVLTHRVETNWRRAPFCIDGSLLYDSQQCEFCFVQSTRCQPGPYPRCPNGGSCRHAHNMEEVLYHPHLFRQKECTKAGTLTKLLPNPNPDRNPNSDTTATLTYPQHTPVPVSDPAHDCNLTVVLPWYRPSRHKPLRLLPPLRAHALRPGHPGLAGG